MDFWNKSGKFNLNLLVVSIIFWISFQVSFTVAQESIPSLGKITFPLGDVWYQSAKEGTEEYANLDQVVYPGDRIKTGSESRCEITLNDGSIVRIGESSLLDLGNSIISSELKIIKLKLLFGRAWLNLQPLSSALDQLEIKSPTAVAAIRGTIFRTDADTSSTLFRVYEGKISVNFNPESQIKTPEKGKFRPPRKIEGPKQIPGPRQVTMKEWMEIVAGEEVRINLNGTVMKSKFNPVADRNISWVKWNLERDRQIKKH